MTLPTLFTVTKQHLSPLSSGDGVDLVADLLWAEARRIALPTSKVHITKNITAKDGGIDASIDPVIDAHFSGSFVPEGRSGFQIKTGSSFSLSKPSIKKELFDKAKPSKAALGQSVRDCLEEGGTYVLVCLGNDPAEPTRSRAKAHLKLFFATAGYPDAKVDIWGQNEVIGLLQRFPSIAVSINGGGHGFFQTHLSWSRQIEMSRPFKVGEPQKEFMLSLQAELRRNDSAVHVRVRGEAGIGKTRLVLESLREDDLHPLVVYHDGPEKFLGSQLLGRLLQDDNDFYVIVVADECDLHSRNVIWNQLGTRGPRVKFVSIYNDIDEPSGATIVLDVPPLADTEISSIIQEYEVPADDAQRFSPGCGGSPRVAHVVGQNLKLNPDNILKDPDSVDVWGRFIAGSLDPNSQEARQRRTVLRFLALFRRFGYEGPVAEEGKAIAKYIQEADPAITPFKFQEIVKSLREMKSLQGTTTLYISPGHLHVKLWAEWFDLYGTGFKIDEFESRFSPDLIAWFREMYAYARQSADAMSAVKKLLAEDGPFGNADSFRDGGNAEFFLRLTDAAPDAALLRLEETIGNWNMEQFRSFTEGRRQVVWALEKIAVWRELFEGAARLLLRLAEAETEKISNNATGVFAELFLPGHGRVAPSEASPEERFPILVEALTSTSSETRAVALKAADKALTTGTFMRTVGAEIQGLRKPPQLWTPTTWGEVFDAYRRVWRLLESHLDELSASDRQEAIKILLNNARGVAGMANLTEMVVDTLVALLSKPYVDRRQVIATVESVYRYDSTGFTDEVRAQWERIRGLLSPTDFHSRLERFVGMDRWADEYDDGGKPTGKVVELIRDLAKDASANKQDLLPELTWLVTEEAKNGFRFGYELGQLDSERQLLDELLQAQRSGGEKSSAFFLSGYVRALAERSQPDFELLLDGLAQDQTLRRIVPELSWRAGLNDRGAQRILSLAHAGVVEPTQFRMFAYGGVIRGLSENAFRDWLDYLLSVNTLTSVGIAVDLSHFFYLMAGEPKKTLPQDTILRLLTAEPFLAASEERNIGGINVEYDWTQLAQAFVTDHAEAAVDLAKKLLGSFGERGTIMEGFRSTSLGVLTEIVRKHPDELWPEVVKHLGPPIDRRAFRVKQWLHDGALSAVSADAVWKWIDEDVEKRASYAASFVPKVFPGQTGACSAREILVRYGDRKDVRNGLHANFSSEFWSGPASSHYESQAKWACDVAKDEANANVRKWLTEFERTAVNRAGAARVQEERGGF